jgi:hypothetical protein
MFAALEARESQESGPGQQLGKCRQMADVTLMNDTDRVEDLYRKVDSLLSGISGKDAGTR